MDNLKLNTRNLSRFADRLAIPKYDRSKVQAGIMHVGIGGFHRAHQAYYVDQLLHTPGNEQWGIVGVALLSFDDKIYQVLKEQDGFYTLVVKELDGSHTRTIIGSIVEYLFAPDNPSAVIEKMADEQIKIITLTITEGGYNYNEATKQFDFSNPLIIHDLENPSSPKTIFGYLTQALKLRKSQDSKGLTIQSCDNIQGNGHVAKKMLLSFVEKAAPDLLKWIESNVSFPNSMVDRITPVTTPLDISNLYDATGIEDAWPVVCEPFMQWVIEDDFKLGRPAWERVGAQFVEDVEPYEKMKLSLLNAGHSLVGILGALMGYETIDESISNKEIGAFFSHYMDKEVTPVLGELEGVNLNTYKQSLVDRFGNIYIKDQVDRICSESSSKIPVFILPTVQAQLKLNGPVESAAFVIAAWAIYSLGVDEKGNRLNIKDVMAEQVHEKALEAKNNPLAFLELEAVFADLKTSSTFAKAFTMAYQKISQYGIEKCLISMNASV